MKWPGTGSMKSRNSFESSTSLSKAILEQRLKTEMAPDTRVFSLDHSTARSSLTSLAQAMASPVPEDAKPFREDPQEEKSRKSSNAGNQVTEGDDTDCDECADCDECEAIMSPYKRLSPPPEGEAEQDIGQDFNPHLPPEQSDTYSEATVTLATTETLPPLPETPLQQNDDYETRQLGSKQLSRTQSTTRSFATVQSSGRQSELKHESSRKQSELEYSDTISSRKPSGMERSDSVKSSRKQSELRYPDTVSSWSRSETMSLGTTQSSKNRSELNRSDTLQSFGTQSELRTLDTQSSRKQSELNPSETVQSSRKQSELKPSETTQFPRKQSELSPLETMQSSRKQSQLNPSETMQSSRKQSEMKSSESQPESITTLPGKKVQSKSSKSSSIPHDGSLSKSITNPHGGDLCHVSSLELQSFPDEPIGGLTPPRALMPIKDIGNKDVPATDLNLNANIPEIRVTTPCISRKPTQVSCERIRSDTASIHSLPETVISERSPEVSPYQQPMAAMSDLLIDHPAQPDRTPTDDAIYQHYNDLVTANAMDHASCYHDLAANETPACQYADEEPVAESSKMAAERAALQKKYGQSNLSPMQERSPNLPKSDETKSVKSTKSALFRIKKVRAIDKHTHKLAKQCARQAKYEARITALQHRDTDGNTSHRGRRRSSLLGRGSENRRRVVIQEDGSAEAQQNSYWTKSAQSLVSRFRPATPQRPESPATPIAAFERLNTISEDRNSSSQDIAFSPPKKPQKRRTKRSRVKSGFKKTVRKTRRALLRDWILRILLGRQLASPTKKMVKAIAKGGSVEGLDQILDSSVPLTHIPAIRIIPPNSK